MRCLDIDVPVGDEEYARVCREILNTCIRNTEEAERVANAKKAAVGESVPSTPASDTPPHSALASFSTVGSGASSTMLIGGTSTPPQTATQKKSLVWGMIEESELAKGVRRRDKEESIGERSKTMVESLRLVLDPPPPPPPSTASESLSGFLSPTFSRLSASFGKSPSPSPTSSPLKPALKATSTTTITEGQFTKATSVWEELGRVIQHITEDPASAPSIPLEELLILHDELGELVKRAEAKMGTVTREKKPVLKLDGLGSMLAPPETQIAAVSIEDGTIPEEQEGEESTPTTPRIDKGKARAEPEPEKHEPVLSPTSSFLISASPTESLSEDEYESAEEGGDEHLSPSLARRRGRGGKFPPLQDPASDFEDEEGPSPTDRSRSWVAEEGEVFRKGTVLLGPEEMEGEWEGEILRREVRSYPRGLLFLLRHIYSAAGCDGRTTSPKRNPRPRSTKHCCVVARARGDAYSTLVTHNDDKFTPDFSCNETTPKAFHFSIQVWVQHERQLADEFGQSHLSVERCARRACVRRDKSGGIRSENPKYEWSWVVKKEREHY